MSALRPGFGKVINVDGLKGLGTMEIPGINSVSFFFTLELENWNFTKVKGKMVPFFASMFLIMRESSSPAFNASFRCSSMVVSLMSSIF